MSPKRKISEQCHAKIDMYAGVLDTTIWWLKGLSHGSRSAEHLPNILVLQELHNQLTSYFEVPPPSSQEDQSDV